MKAFKCNRCKRFVQGFSRPGMVVFERKQRFAVSLKWTGADHLDKLDVCDNCQAILLRLVADKLATDGS